MSRKAATYLCSTSIVHHRCPTVMAGIAQRWAAASRISVVPPKAGTQFADGIRSDLLSDEYSRALEAAIVWPCPGVFGSCWQIVSIFEKGGVCRPHGLGACPS